MRFLAATISAIFLASCTYESLSEMASKAPYRIWSSTHSIDEVAACVVRTYKLPPNSRPDKVGDKYVMPDYSTGHGVVFYWEIAPNGAGSLTKVWRQKGSHRNLDKFNRCF